MILTHPPALIRCRTQALGDQPRRVRSAKPKTNPELSWRRVSGLKAQKTTQAPIRTFDVHSARHWGQLFARCVIEVYFGYRPIAHIERWLSPQVIAIFKQYVAENIQNKPITKAAQILSANAWPAADGAFEISSTVHNGHRPCAIALRIQPHLDHWQVVAVEFA